ncbi:hypothetical protein LAZ67_21001601 [Cordylochernes scorpioides]|uniref:Secreted protein n=1 Tax=Cordylochernes scorpioides TaxID=51811 RepID=A0ABY6LM51_9ARAC|nr:hypothetical protein LAZ67_21001601 [Cordylochernes scorpioides]
MQYSVAILALVLVAVAWAAPEPAASPAPNSRSARFDERKFGSSKHMQEVMSADSKKDISQFVTSKNMIRTLVKLVFGSDEESAATSRQILNILVNVLEMLKTSLGQRGRSARSGEDNRSVLDKAAISGAAMLQGYVKSVLANSTDCIQKYMCEASNSAVKEGQDVGYVIAQVGGYAASYLLESQKAVPLQVNLNATRKGRSGDDCFAAMQACQENATSAQ